MGVSSTRYTIKLLPIEFAILCLLILVGDSLSSSSEDELSPSDSSQNSVGVSGSRIGSYFQLYILLISLIGNISSKNVNLWIQRW
jgi:hypothetical protein